MTIDTIIRNLNPTLPVPYLSNRGILDFDGSFILSTHGASTLMVYLYNQVPELLNCEEQPQDAAFWPTTIWIVNFIDATDCASDKWLDYNNPYLVNSTVLKYIKQWTVLSNHLSFSDFQGIRSSDSSTYNGCCNGNLVNCFPISLGSIYTLFPFAQFESTLDEFILNYQVDVRDNYKNLDFFRDKGLPFTSLDLCESLEAESQSNIYLTLDNNYLDNFNVSYEEIIDDSFILSDQFLQDLNLNVADVNLRSLRTANNPALNDVVRILTLDMSDYQGIVGQDYDILSCVPTVSIVILTCEFNPCDDIGHGIFLKISISTSLINDIILIRLSNACVEISKDLRLTMLSLVIRLFPSLVNLEFDVPIPFTDGSILIESIYCPSPFCTCFPQLCISDVEEVRNLEPIMDDNGDFKFNVNDFTNIEITIPNVDNLQDPPIITPETNTPLTEIDFPPDEDPCLYIDCEDEDNPPPIRRVEDGEEIDCDLECNSSQIKVSSSDGSKCFCIKDQSDETDYVCPEGYTKIYQPLSPESDKFGYICIPDNSIEDDLTQVEPDPLDGCPFCEAGSNNYLIAFVHFHGKYGGSFRKYNIVVRYDVPTKSCTTVLGISYYTLGRSAILSTSPSNYPTVLNGQDTASTTQFVYNYESFAASSRENWKGGLIEGKGYFTGCRPTPPQCLNVWEIVFTKLQIMNLFDALSLSDPKVRTFSTIVNIPCEATDVQLVKTIESCNNFNECLIFTLKSGGILTALRSLIHGTFNKWSVTYTLNGENKEIYINSMEGAKVANIYKKRTIFN